MDTSLKCILNCTPEHRRQSQEGRRRDRLQRRVGGRGRRRLRPRRHGLRGCRRQRPQGASQEHLQQDQVHHTVVLEDRLFRIGDFSYRVARQNGIDLPLTQSQLWQLGGRYCGFLLLDDRISQILVKREAFTILVTLFMFQRMSLSRVVHLSLSPLSLSHL